MNQIYQSSTEIRNNFSLTIDKAVHERPQFIKRTHDKVVLISDEYLYVILDQFRIDCNVKKEKDGTFILTNEIIDDIIATGNSLEKAKEDLSNQLLDYAREYYESFDLYSKAPNRKKHLAYVMKILMLGDPVLVEGILVCQDGKN